MLLRSVLFALAALSIPTTPLSTTAERASTPNDTWAHGKSGCVVAAEPQAARIGLDVLRRGGNAIDAAVATFLALAVTHPQAGNLGGGGFFVIRMADGRTAAIDFREQAPSRAHRDMYLRADGSVDASKSLRGALAGGVPGSAAGLAHTLAKFGTKPLAELAAPSIRLARDGFVVDHFLADSLANARELFARFPSTQAIFWRDGRPLAAGEQLVQADLADTLTRFAESGFDGFYRGETAQRFARFMSESGGWIETKDLANYVVRERDVLSIRYRGHEVLSMPPVSSGGVALLSMLRMLEPYDLHGMGAGSAQTLHLLTEVMRRAYADRARWLGDPDHFAVPIEGMLSAEYADRLRAGIRSDKRSEVDAGLPPGAPDPTAGESKETTHFSVVDAAGNAVSCTTTINSTFGAGIVVGGLGFLLNNEMDDFSAKPGVPNQFGLVGGEANAIAPGKRPLSSMTPTIVVKDGKVRYVLGSPGGGRIINTVFQVLLNLVDHGMPLRDAVTTPRIHHQWKPDEIAWERNAINPDSRRILEAMGHRFARRPSAIGRCQAIEVQSDGTRVGAADPRSGGAAVAY